MPQLSPAQGLLLIMVSLIGMMILVILLSYTTLPVSSRVKFMTEEQHAAALVGWYHKLEGYSCISLLFD